MANIDEYPCSTCTLPGPRVQNRVTVLRVPFGWPAQWLHVVTEIILAKAQHRQRNEKETNRSQRRQLTLPSKDITSEKPM